MVLPSPACYAAAAALAFAQQPQPPKCDEELYTRPLNGIPGLIGSHQYMVVNDGMGNEWTIEGEPQQAQAFNWGNLVSSAIENGYGAHDDPSKDKVFGGDWIIPCSEVDGLVAIAQSFNGTAKYTPGGPNSNSFMNWFLNKSGLSFLYPTAPPFAIGWYATIPGN